MSASVPVQRKFSPVAHLHSSLKLDSKKHFNLISWLYIFFDDSLTSNYNVRDPNSVDR